MKYIVGDDLVKGIYERRFSTNRVPTAEPTSSVEQRERGVRSRTTAGAFAELTRWAVQNLELTLKSEINIGPRLSEEGRLKRRSRKCNTTRGEPKACTKEEANQSEWIQGREKRKIEQCKGERSCPLFSGTAYVEKEGAGKEEQSFYFGTCGGGFG
ncbi:hypothetical protein QVD17_41508 [Tagetes erecta]|uniref:Uncharacterized protein n=1 Tax=Tagetes erecta TaxID=13708 RepID=A0AAD8NDQ9_TARER|nr:hypothetical protein QVD17_41508 [Tagetes erecta]